MRRVALHQTVAVPGGYEFLKSLEASMTSAYTEDEIVALIKPQFEAGRRQVNKGVVRDPTVHEQVVQDLVEWSTSQPWRITDVIPSPLKGPAGNIEFLSHWTRTGIISPGC